MLKAIVACSPEGIIAIDGKMPWDVPEDLKRFQRLTLNNVVVMGRVTWDTLNRKPLSNRVNYIVSRSHQPSLVKDTEAKCFTHIDYAISEAELSYSDKGIWIIGGGSVYTQTLPICDELYLTIINKDEVCYSEGRLTYLEEFSSLDKFFIEVSSETTRYATYKKYKRRTSYKRDKDRTVYS